MNSYAIKLSKPESGIITTDINLKIVRLIGGYTSIQLIVLGIIGEYLGKLFMENKHLLIPMGLKEAKLCGAYEVLSVSEIPRLREGGEALHVPNIPERS